MSWDDYADGWDEDEEARAYSRAAFECLTRLCSAQGRRLHGARVVDFGCGTGLLTEKLAPLCATIVAVDTSERMIDRLRHKIERLSLSNVQTTTEQIEHAVRHDTLFAKPFDLVVCSSVCAFLDDYPGTTRTLAGLLKPGGLYVQWDWELDPDDREPFGLTREQVRDALSGSGLEAIQVEPAFEIAIGETTTRPLMGVGRAPE